MKVQRNRHPAGRLANMAYGAASLVDGIVRVLSLGHLHTTLPLDVSRWQAKHMIVRLKSGRR
ncbi:hypothetical protein D9M68_940480 [compost metagenome]